MNSTYWNERFAGDDFRYGTAPNDFLAAHVASIPHGRVLCLAEGEGRNAVFLAARGFTVTAVDSSDVALAKAQRLAAERGVMIETQVVDLGTYAIEPAAWSGIVSIWAHLPLELRRTVHAQVVRGLGPGGVFFLEAYTPAQIALGTGGPREPQLCMTASALRDELAGLDFEIIRELERDVHEGIGHHGRGAVVQVLARRS